ncbi:MFS transporter [Pseudoroseicyclus sp. CXY001]|uniref:MFS transporter n=1 Tax=Pseudoroseicyclus sp. CXY001 TaxID=3242492 RepID=UPI00358DC0BB
MTDTPARPGLSLAGLITHVLVTQLVVIVARVTTSYRAIELGASELWIGIIAASFSVLPLLGATLTGQWIDRRGARGAMLAGGIGMSAGCIGLIVLGFSPWGLVLASAVLGLGHVTCMLSQHAYMASAGEDRQMDRRFGQYAVLIALGQVIAPMVVGMIGGSREIPQTGTLFLTAAGLSALSLCGILLIDFRSARPRSTERTNIPMWALLRSPGVRPAIMGGVAVICAIDLLVVYLPAIGAGAGISAAMVASLLSLRAGTSLASRLFFQWFLAAFGRRFLLTGSLALTGIALCLMNAGLPAWALIVSMVFLGLGAGFSIPLSMSWIASIVPPDARGLALSLRLTGNRFAQLVLPPAVGVFAAASSLGLAFMVLGGAVLIVARQTDRALNEHNRVT